MTTMIESCDDSLEKDDVIYCDPNELELVEDVSVVIEDDAEKAQRLYHLLTGSASGVLTSDADLNYAPKMSNYSIFI